jgi:CheY-like chemotaxis protein
VLDLNAIVTDMERMLGRMVGDDVDLLVDLDPDLAPIRADAAQVEQMLANLVVNARDAMPEGGRVSITTRNVRLNGDARRLELQPGSYVSLRVADTGLGMDEQTMTRAFDPFFTTKEDGLGTGLGLATVHGIVTQSGGGVEIESTPGEGATICIHLPAAESGVVEVRDGQPLRAADGGRERVLFVEDEPVVRRLIASFLGSLGYDVVSVADGPAALEVAGTSGPFDLVVTDFVLPGPSGTELVSRLASLGTKSPVLFISGYAPGADFAEAGSTGRRTGFLQKPFTREDLARSVRALLDAENGSA